MERLGRQLGFKRLHPHALRAVFISEALRGGASLDSVQAAASHADPRTTLKYDRRAADLGAGHPARFVSSILAAA